ncbi:HNH endonuclease [Massilia sp. P8910]|uniref:HNH endonuclease signature motif containing protein n=1 Tax=Massilia antarctica TaxID=2765360 RepID=UPI001E5F12D7|nr:HNH endonuclease signature motif containing protein [Massilia antarctica]MCE3606373.1 HNH endonuclease [Massilia antarctica]
MHKPKWMTSLQWVEFGKRWADESGRIHCVGLACNSPDDRRMTVDHIQPRTAGGADEVANYQPLCDICNSKKGNRADWYWKETFYFDKPLVTTKLRISQHDFVYNRVLEFGEFFARPYSAVNSKLFCFLQAVAAGKALGIFTLPFALNRCSTAHWPAAPRVDRMLIVTKDQALRSQFAHELREEPLRFGLVNEAPRVVEITRGEMLAGDSPDYDIAVMCPNMLWPQAGSNYQTGELLLAWAPGIESVLHRHPLIVFDEMHYAHGGIRLLIGAARHSLVFGFTASPIDAYGELLADMVKMSVYGYHDAVRNDGSMKYIR